MRPWQQNVLFCVGVGGAVVLAFGPAFGLDIQENPTAYSGIGAILAYVLAQKFTGNKKSKDDDGND